MTHTSNQKCEENRVPNAVQIALFTANPPKADVVAQTCFPGISISSSMMQNDVSNAQLEGELERQVACSGGLGRIDFTWEPRNAPPAFNQDLIDLESINGDIMAIEHYAAKQAVDRVACILRFRHHIANPEEGIEKVREAIKGLEIPTGASEITFRTNVPALLHGYMLNRIVVWQNAKVGFVKVAQSGPLQQVMHDIMEHQVDVNTVVENKLGEGEAGKALNIVRAEAVRLLNSGFEK
tara:strand:+ start:173 stop:886 length:714 start_codon:yes stop_codon:yes gene_type:complete